MKGYTVCKVLSKPRLARPQNVKCPMRTSTAHPAMRCRDSAPRTAARTLARRPLVICMRSCSPSTAVPRISTVPVFTSDLCISRCTASKLSTHRLTTERAASSDEDRQPKLSTYT